jgi:16S rRNA U516 pseudouridylate synthase RsuA-like enzyme
MYLRNALDAQLSNATNTQPDDSNYVLHRIGSPSHYSYVRLSVTEGKYRMVRRILHNAGHSVLLLHRRSIGPFSIADDDRTCAKSAEHRWPPTSSIPTGEMRACTEEEEAQLVMMLASLKKR